MSRPYILIQAILMQRTGCQLRCAIILTIDGNPSHVVHATGHCPTVNLEQREIMLGFYSVALGFLSCGLVQLRNKIWTAHDLMPYSLNKALTRQFKIQA